jgi:hypothetical protein
MYEDFILLPVPHPAFSSDLAPSDFDLFGTIKGKWTRGSFQDAGEPVGPVRDVATFIRPSELDAGFRNRDERLGRCLESLGEYAD